ncbi:glycoside hydrolase family 20 protein [Streptomyces xiamenensis]|uniref:beta-N-acetylhexosaminidase n=1 Tax=Streptomyces xiamenensis TaxID=408015 RepID=UPI0036E1D3A3
MKSTVWRIWAIVAVVGLIATATALVVTQRSDGGDTASDHPDPTQTSPAANLPDPVLADGPTGDLQTVPQVTTWEPADGPGWAPSDTTRVVTESGSDATGAADRLADELSVDRADDGARASDVLLTIDPNAGTGPEGYSLTTRDHQVTITAETGAGAFYGTRTVVQSVRADGGLPEGSVQDAPDREQRGLMLDTARKFYSAEWIEERLHELADLKLNEFHLHFSDDQGFRIESESHPEIVSQEHLTKDEVTSIVELAESLHITVIPEIDSPGHLGAVLDANPDLQLKRADGSVSEGAIDISNPDSAALIDDLLREYAPLFPGEYFHVGGDEYPALYSSDPEATYPNLARAAEEQYGAGATVRDLATGWINDRAATARDLGKTPQVWNDGMHAGGKVQPSEDRQVTYWTGREIGAREPQEYLDQGFPLINLNSAYLYYVLGEPNEFTYPTGEAIYNEWTPDVVRGSTALPEGEGGPEHVLGARFAIWCDLADAQTPEQVAEGIRLPLAAMAQKTWHAGEPSGTWTEFTQRVDNVG